MPSEVTDPALLRQLNGTPQEVTDPAILQRLNSAAPHDNYIPPDLSAPLQNNPMSNMGFFRNALYGIGETGANLGTGIEQLYARATGNQSLLQSLQARTASDRHLYAPVNKSIGGKVGQFLETSALTAPLSTTGAGAFLSGAALGGLQPTAEGENPLTNAAVGGTLSLAGYGAGKALGKWAANRFSQPFMGWNQSTVNQAAANAIGETADAPTQGVVDTAFRRLGDVFNRAHDPATAIPLGQDMSQAVSDIANKFGSKALASSQEVTDLLGYVQSGNATAQDLGTLSNRLRVAAQSEIGSKTGDKALGNALYALREHLDDLIGASIQDPELASQYALARPQYRTLMDLTGRPSILNSASGDVNATALGKYLQRADKFGYTRGNNTSELYNAARWGQITGEGAGAPHFTLTNFGLPFYKYYALNNPLSRAMGGAVSRVLGPVSGALPTAGAVAADNSATDAGAAVGRLLPGLKIGLPGTPVPYLTE